MSYPRILQKVYCEPWAVRPETHRAIRDVLASKLSGEAHIQAAMSTAKPAAGPYGTAAMPGSSLQTRGRVALIQGYGIIGSHLSGMEMMCGGLSVDYMQAQLREAALNPNIKTVLIDWASPGGTISGVPETAAMLKTLGATKDTISYCSDEMCSAAYWIGSQANSVLFTESAYVGSIGVYIALLDESEAMAKDGVKLELFKAGKFKAAGNGAIPMTDEERAIFQGIVDQTYSAFTRDVRKSRAGIRTETMQGQVFSGKPAEDAKLGSLTKMSLAELVDRKA